MAAGLGACSSGFALGPSDIERTWEYAVVALPPISAEAPLLSRMNNPDVADRLLLVPDGKRLPVVVYMHGCTGVGNVEFLQSLAQAGFAVIAPDSFARAFRPLQCDPEAKTGGYNVFIYDFRQAEISFALEQLWSEDWADWSRMVLVGASEGAVAAALYRGDEFKGRVIAQWTCTGAPLVSGIAAPLDEPVLAVVGEEDPWYVPVTEANGTGDCGLFLVDRPGSRSLVVEGPGAHDVFQDAIAVETMVDFLKRATAP